MKLSSYKSLAAVVTIHLFIMFALTYSGVYVFHHIYPNLNRFYMAVVMVMPMIVLMLFFMGNMFENKMLNIALYIFSGFIFIWTFYAIRTQALIGNSQFLKSMIPHHSIAIKTCERAHYTDPEIDRLCKQIIEAQKEEINKMEEILRRIGN